MEMNKICQSKWLKIALLVLGVLILVGASFGAGMFVGFKKAGFSYGWGENYHRNFGGPRGGFAGEFMGRDMMNANGVVGQIIKIDGQTLVIKGQDNVEKIVLLKTESVLREHMNTIASADLKVGDFVVVIGEPNDQGQIEAKFVRVMPPPPTGASDQGSYRDQGGRRGMMQPSFFGR
jgi:hypothetical protein